MNRKIHIIFLILSLFILSCGGGGGGESISPNTPPSTPESVLATGGNGVVRLSWGNASESSQDTLESAGGGTTYNIYWSTTAGVVKKTGTKISGADNPYYHNGLSNNTTYYYVVTAENQYGESNESAEVSAKPSSDSLPLPPTHIATMSLNEQVIVRWTPTETEDVNTSHNLYWSTFSGVTKTTGEKIADVVSPYTHEGLSNGTSYYYVVTTVNQRGESIESEEASAKPDNTFSPPPAPTEVTATAGDRQVTISWSAVGNALSYNLYYANESSASWTEITGVTSPYTHANLAQGSVYYYAVTAVNGYGEGSRSATVSVTIPDSRNDICVALGDSITVGYGVTYAQSYVPLLSAAWGKTIYNEGVLGALSSYGANIIDSVLDEYNPKYITIFYGNNDDGFYNVDWIISNLRSIIVKAKANGTEPVIATLTPVFGTWAWRKSSEVTLNERIRQLASEEGIACADLEASFGWNESYILSDGMHPNSAGHKIIANTFRSALTR